MIATSEVTDKVPPPKAHEDELEGDEEEDEDETLANGAPSTEGAKKKKKKKKPKKKKVEQTDPPRIGLSKIFSSGVFPIGETHEYKDECVKVIVGFICHV